MLGQTALPGLHDPRCRLGLLSSHPFFSPSSKRSGFLGRAPMGGVRPTMGLWQEVAHCLQGSTASAGGSGGSASPQSQSLEWSQPRWQARGQVRDSGLGSRHGCAARGEQARAGFSAVEAAQMDSALNAGGVGTTHPSPLHGETHVDVWFHFIKWAFALLKFSLSIQIHKTFLLQKLWKSKAF